MPRNAARSSPPSSITLRLSLGSVGIWSATARWKAGGYTAMRGHGSLVFWLPHALKNSIVQVMITWRIIPSFPQYEVSSVGGVRRASSKRELTPHINLRGYFYITLMKPKHLRLQGNPKYSFTRVPMGRIICEAFYGAPPEKRSQAAHNNGNPSDNRVENLRWATPLENSQDQYKHGTRVHGARVKCAKLTEAMVSEIRSRRVAGEVWSSLSASFGVSVRAVRDAVRGRSWKHVQ